MNSSIGQQQAAGSSAAKIIRNTVFNTMGRLWVIGVAFFLTPYVIHKIGVELYGIWAVVGVVTGYFGLLDFGVATSLVKHVSECDARKDSEAMNRVIHTSFLFYSCFGVVIAVLGLAFTNYFLRWFNIPENYLEQARSVFLLGVLVYAASHLLNTFRAVLNGLQRMDITNKISVTLSVVSIAGTVFFLEMGYGLFGLMVNNAIVYLAGGVMSGVIALRLLPEVKVLPLCFDPKLLVKLVKFGLQIWTAGIASLFHFQFDKLLLAHFSGLSAVAFYDVASKIVTHAREVPLFFSSAIMPAAAELSALKDRKKLEELYFRTTKYMLVSGVAIGSPVIMFAQPFIDVWVGPGFEKTVATTQILMVGYFFNTLTASGYFILNGIGKPEYGMRSSLVATLSNCILSTVLIIHVGYFGVVLGTVISMVTAAAYFIAMVHKEIQKPVFSFWPRLLAAPLASALLAGVLANRFQILMPASWVGLLAIATVYLALFGLGVIAFGYFDAYDKDLFERHVTRKLKEKRIHFATMMGGKGA
jgi:O-antigen/teichoic acid export membrane protein